MESLRQSFLSPSTDTIDRCLRSVKELAPKALVRLSVFHDTNRDVSQMSTVADVLVAFAPRRLVIDTLDISEPSLTELVNELRHGRGIGSVSRLPLLRNLSYSGTLDLPGHTLVNNTRQIRRLLKSARRLRSLRLSLDGISYKGLLLPATAAILAANDFSRLTSFHLESAAVAGPELTAALARCGSSLLTMGLKDIWFVTNNPAWLSIFFILSSMPRLSAASFDGFFTDIISGRQLDFAGLIHGSNIHHDRIQYIGREQVTAGLGELVSANLKARRRSPRLQMNRSLN